MEYSALAAHRIFDVRFSSVLKNPRSMVLDEGEKVTVFAGERFIGCYPIVNEGEVRAVPEFVLN